MTGRRPLPSGTVTFLFTDIEGSTRLLQDLGAEHYGATLAEHRRAFRTAIAAHGGVEIDTQGDAFFVAFADAADAVAAAGAAQDALADGPIRVRMGIHTGMPQVTSEGYVGTDVHLGARIAAAGHGGQVLLSKATRDLVTANTTDLGEHRLKDFDQPVWIYQLGDESFPPLRSISNTNLPRPSSTFVGREREVSEVADLLRDGARIVTLTGSGGTGKTRLSLEAAAGLVSEFRNGTYWVDLAPVSDPGLVLNTIGSTVGARDDLAGFIGERQMLLVLDNLEQVIDAAPQLASLVAACPDLRILATSRERLRVHDEVEYRVAPLPNLDAVSLFVARAGIAVDTADPAVSALCERLDNLPLAIELAAARTSVLSPAQILSRLAQRLDLLKGGRDAAARQQTLRATIEWSYELLEEQEKRLFARLAAFGGGWTLEAAEAVADADLDLLQSLVDKSLVQFAGERFTMLETIRQYAVDLLDASREGQNVRERHASYFLDVARRAEPHLRAESAEHTDRLEEELDNFRAALAWYAHSESGDGYAELAAAIWPLWSARASLSEGSRLLAQALERHRASDALRAELLSGAADFALDTGDVEFARSAASEARSLFHAEGETWHEAYTLLEIGLSYSIVGDFVTAQPFFAQSAELFDELGDAHWAMQAIRRLAWAYESLDDKPRAAQIWQATLKRAHETNDAFGEARARGVLAQYEIDEGRVNEEVLENLRRAHSIHRDRRDMTDKYWDAILLCRLAQALVIQHKPALAASLMARYETRLVEIEGPREQWVIDMMEPTEKQLQQQLTAAQRAEAEDIGRAMSFEDAVAEGITAVEESLGG